MEKKILHEIKFLQKFKDFYSKKINSIPKKFSFWILAIILFIFLLPFCLGGILIYLISKVKTEHFLIKTGLVILISITVLSVEIGWTKNLLGMNTPPNLVISNPIMAETKVKGVNTIEISGKINPKGSTIKINNNIVTITDNDDFIKEVFIKKGKNEINIIGKHGFGITEKTIVVYREFTEKEIVEEKRLEEEQKIKDEEKRIAREEARKKAEQEAQVKADVERRDKEEAEEKRRQELANTFCETRSKSYARYVNLDEFAEMMKKGGTFRNVYNKPPSKSSCRNIAEQCLRVWSEEDCKNIAEKTIWLGMTANQLILSWRIPNDKNNTVGMWGVNSQWVYGDFGPYVYLEGDNKEDLVVTSWQD